MKILFSSFILFFLFAQKSFYDLSATEIDGTPFNFEEFHGRKILIVNIATDGTKSGQFLELKQLQSQFKNSLRIIGFPSNSFGNESRGNQEIQEYLHSNFAINFLLASKGSVTGNDIQPVFEWLTNVSKNKSFNIQVKDDFQKYIIDKNGELVAVFSGHVSPLSNEIISVLSSP